MFWCYWKAKSHNSCISSANLVFTFQKPWFAFQNCVYLNPNQHLELSIEIKFCLYSIPVNNSYTTTSTDILGNINKFGTLVDALTSLLIFSCPLTQFQLGNPIILNLGASLPIQESSWASFRASRTNLSTPFEVPPQTNKKQLNANCF